MKAFIFLPLILLTGCFTAPNKPNSLLPNISVIPPLPVQINAESDTKSIILPQWHTNVISADFPAQEGTAAFFQCSADLKNWTTFCEYPYPIDTATLTATNTFLGTVMFYRAGCF